MTDKNQDKATDKTLGKAEHKSNVQGEGDYESARRYDKNVRDFVKSGHVEEAAEEARKARAGGEREEMNRAEKAGKDKAKGFDPQVKRD